MSNSSETECRNWPSLIQRAKLGDDDAFGQIASYVRPYLFSVMDCQVGEQLKAKFCVSDIVQQSLMEASQAMDRFRGSTELELKVWLKRIALNNLKDAARQFTTTQSRNVVREVSISAEDGWQQVACPKSKPASWFMKRDEQSEQLLRCILRLPERQREIVEGRHCLGRSYHQLAEELGITENACRNLWIRAIQSLRAMLQEDDGDLQERRRLRKPK